MKSVLSLSALCIALAPLSADAAKPPPPPPDRHTLITDLGTTVPQSMWDAGETPGLFPDGDQVLSLYSFEVGPLEGGASYKKSVTSWATFGGSISGSISATAGLEASLSGFSAGEVDVDYPVRVDVYTPAPNSFLAGETIQIPTSWRLEDGAKLTTASPTSGIAKLEAYIDATASVSAELCVFGCVSVSPSLSITDGDPDTPGDQPYRVTVAQVGDLTEQDTDKCPVFAAGLGLPDVATTSRVAADGRSLVATGSGEFVAGGVELATLQEVLECKLLQQFGVSPPNLEMKFIDMAGGLFMRMEQEFTFTPTVRVGFQFDRDVQWREVGGEVDGDWFTSDLAEIDAGHTLEVIVPDDPDQQWNVTPQVRVEGRLANRTTLRVGGSPSIEVFHGEVDVPSYKVVSMPPGIPDIRSPHIHFGVGPLYTYQLPTIGLSQDLRDDDWDLGGLPTVTMDTVVLDQERVPVAIASGPTGAFPEGTPVSFTAAQSYDEDPDPLSFSWAFGDGTGSIGADATHAYPDDGAFTTQVVVDDSHGNAPTVDLDVTVTNVAPTVTAGGTRVTTEGKPVSLGPAALGTNLVVNGDAEDGKTGWTQADGMAVRTYAAASGTLSGTSLIGQNLVRDGGGEDPSDAGYWQPQLHVAGYGDPTKDDPGFPLDTQIMMTIDPYVLTTPPTPADGGGFEDPWICVETPQGTPPLICSYVWKPIGSNDPYLEFHSYDFDEPYYGFYSRPVVGGQAVGDDHYHRPNYLRADGSWVSNPVTSDWQIAPETNVYAQAGALWYTFSGMMRSDAGGSYAYSELFFHDDSAGPSTSPEHVIWGPSDGSGQWLYQTRWGQVPPEADRFEVTSRGAGTMAATDQLYFEYRMNEDVLSFPTLEDAGSDSGGAFLFGGQQASSQISQGLDVAPLAALVDEGLVTLDLQALLGGMSVQRDRASVTVAFLDEAGVPVGDTTIGPVTAADRGNATTLLPRSAVGVVVPAGTRALDVRVSMVREDGARNDGYVDNLTVVLNIPDGVDPAKLPAGGLLATNSPGPALRGSSFFGGDVGTAGVIGTQTIDIPAEVAGMAGLTFDLSAWLGGFADQDDAGIVTATFLDAGGSELSTAELVGPNATERADTSSLQRRSTTGPVPAGTTHVRITLTSTSAGTARADGFIDNVSFVLDGPGHVGFTDPGLADTHTATVDWGDGTTGVPSLAQEPGSGTITATHVYADEPDLPATAYDVTLTVTDDDGGAGSAQTQITVLNLPPTVAAAPLAVVNNQATLLDVATFVDPGVADTHVAEVDWGDGNGFQPAVVLGDTVQATADVALLDAQLPATLPVTVRVTDDSNESGYASTTLTVVKYPLPDVTASANPADPDEGGAAQLTFSLASPLPGNFDTFEAEWQLPDGTTIAAPVDGSAVSHVFPQDGSHLATITIRGYSSGVLAAVTSDTVTVSVGNVLPVVEAGPAQDSFEGVPVQLAASFTDPGVEDPHTARVSWGDGAVDELPVEALTTATHAYGEQGWYHPEVCVIDDHGEGCDTFDVIVDNAAPSLTASASPTAAAEGEVVTVTGHTVDPGSSDTVTVTIGWAGPSQTVLPDANGDFTATHVFAQSGSKSIQVCATDDDGSSRCRALPVSVANDAPVVSGALDVSGAEGAPTAVAAAFTDTGVQDVHTATIAWGDGTTSPGAVTQGAGGGFVSGEHVYADSGPFAVTVTVDDGAATGQGSLTATIANRAPVVTAATVGGAIEGQVATLSGVFTDPGAADTHVATIDWGDGTTTAGTIQPGGVVDGTHVYAAPGSHVVTLTVTDDDGGQGSATAAVEVADAAPAIAVAPEHLDVVEGDAVDLGVLTVTDPSSQPGEVVVTLDFGETVEAPNVLDPLEVVATATAAAGGGTSVDVQAPIYAYSNEGDYTVTVCATDAAGHQGCDALTVTVTNAAPIVDAGEDRVVAEGATVEFPVVAAPDGDVPAEFADGEPRPFMFTDKGTADTHVATVDWGDGEPVEAIDPGALSEFPYGPPGSVEGQGGYVSASHVYADDGTYTVEVCVDDGVVMGCDQLFVTVTNADPAVTALAAATVQAGSPLDLGTATFEDPGFDHAAGATVEDFTATIDWGDGLPLEVVDAASVAEVPGSAGAPTTGSVTLPPHTYAAAGLYEAWFCVDDDDDGHGCAIASVEVLPAPLSVASMDAPPITEGAAAVVTATIDNPSGAALTASWSFDVLGSCAATEQVAAGQTTVQVSASCAYGDDGLYGVTLTITDGASQASASATIDVADSAPTVALATDDALVLPSGAEAWLAAVDAPASWTADAFDAGSDDAAFLWTLAPETATRTATVFNDGQGPDAAMTPGGQAPFAAADTFEHTFSTPGVYTVRVEVADDEGASGADELPVAVTGAGTCGLTRGAWQAQRDGCWDPAIPVADQDGYLEVVAFASDVFGDSVPLDDAASVDAALDGLAVQGVSQFDEFDDALGQLGAMSTAELRDGCVADLLAVWLNVAHGGASLDQSIGWVSFFGSMSLEQVIDSVEGVLTAQSPSTFSLQVARYRIAQAAFQTASCTGGFDTCAP